MSMKPDQGGSPTALARFAGAAATGLGLACTLVLLFMMCLTGADVIARYLFNAPITGAFELVELAMVVLVYLALPLAVLANAHVEVEIWEPKSPVSIRFCLILAGICGVVMFTIFAIELYEHGAKFAKRETVTNSLGLPLKYIAYAAMIGAAFSAFFVLLNLIERMKSS